MSALLSLEEEILLLALLYPSAAIADSLVRLPWRDARCRQAWDVLGTQVARGALQIAEAVGTLPQELQDWLTPLVMQQRSYRDASETLGRFLKSWQRHAETMEFDRLRVEIDSMLEGRIPLDAQKVEVFKDLSQRLKGSVKDVPVHEEASTHGRS